MEQLQLQWLWQAHIAFYRSIDTVTRPEKNLMIVLGLRPRISALRASDSDLDSSVLTNEDVRIATQQPPLSSIVKTRRLSLFGHIARMNESADASCILFEPPSEVWRKPRGRPRNSWVRTVTNDLAKSYTGLPEAKEAAQDRALWRMFTKHSATHS